MEKYRQMIWPYTLHQKNSQTRNWEYPFAMIEIAKYRRVFRKLSIIEIGGANSCFQYYYGQRGADYTNVDTTPEKCNPEIAIKYGVSPKYIFGKFEDVKIESSRYDILLCISVLEHTDWGSESGILKNISKCLRPGGIAVFTVDWFFDLGFDNVCQWGRNVDCRKFIDKACEYDLEKVAGEEKYLSGYADFNERLIRSDAYIMKVCNRGTWLTSQGFVLKKKK